MWSQSVRRNPAARLGRVAAGVLGEWCVAGSTRWAHRRPPHVHPDRGLPSSNRSRSCSLVLRRQRPVPTTERLLGAVRVVDVDPHRCSPRLVAGVGGGAVERHQLVAAEHPNASVTSSLGGTATVATTVAGSGTLTASGTTGGGGAAADAAVTRVSARRSWSTASA